MNSNANESAASETIDRFLYNQHRRDIRQFLLLGFFSVMLLASLAVAFIAWGQGSGGFSLLAPLILTLLSAVLIFRQWRVMLATSRHYRELSLPLAAVIENMAASSQRRIREYRLLMAGVIFVMLPVFAIATLQLFLNGKMSGSDAVSFMLLVFVATAATLVSLRHRIRNQLQPQLDRLDVLRKQV